MTRRSNNINHVSELYFLLLNCALHAVHIRFNAGKSFKSQYALSLPEEFLFNRDLAAQHLMNPRVFE